jgi:hypothetical protein
MKISCPHCSQHLELDSETLIALEGQSHFDCPTCGIAMAVPQVQAVLVPPRQAATTAAAQHRSLPALMKKPRRGLIIAGIGVFAIIAAGLFFFIGGGSNMKPFVNTLGMTFVPVPETNVLFCVHEVRYRDYAAFANESAGVSGAWKGQAIDGFTPATKLEDHPVVKVSWDDAKKFCAWLSKKEGRTYRLPTDQEWSYAVGIGTKEIRQVGTTPATISRSQTEFPWGDQWPPPLGSGNYSDQSRKAQAPNSRANDGYLNDYDDGFPTAAPVMSFRPNTLGIYDLEGNVREWCEDWFDSEKKDRLIRGGCWHICSPRWLLSSLRVHDKSDHGAISNGFRCVVESEIQTTPVP